MELVGGRGQQLLEVVVNVEARLSKALDAAVVALGETLNITSDMIDASRLAWITGSLLRSNHVIYNKKAVISQRLPRDAPTKVNKQPHLHLRSRDSRLTQFNRTLWT